MGNNLNWAELVSQLNALVTSQSHRQSYRIAPQIVANVLPGYPATCWPTFPSTLLTLVPSSWSLVLDTSLWGSSLELASDSWRLVRPLDAERRQKTDRRLHVVRERSASLREPRDVFWESQGYVWHAPADIPLQNDQWGSGTSWRHVGGHVQGRKGRRELPSWFGASHGATGPVTSYHGTFDPSTGVLLGVSLI